MSGFFGIFRPQGGPVDLEAFEQMRKATEREGFDGLETHVEEKIAMGHLMLRVSPESKYDKQPLKSDCGNYLLVGHFRLDYRDELGDKLGLTQSELELTPDSQLVMLSYKKWKEKCVEHIEGDWAFVIFQYHSKTIFVSKDPFGYSALYYRKEMGQYFFATNANYISSIKRLRSEINFIQFFRQSLLGVGPSLINTLIKGILAFENSTYSMIQNDLSEKKVGYFIIPNKVFIRFKKELDYSMELASIFSQAIRSRISQNKDIGILLSGGLDSIGVAYFTSNIMITKNIFLNSYTSFPYYLSQISSKNLDVADEAPFVKSFIQQSKNIHDKYFNFPDAQLSELLISDYTHDAFSPIITPNSFWIEGILSQVKNDKIKILLNGQLGNFTITPAAPFIHAEMLLSFRFRSLYKDLKVISNNSSKSLIKVFRQRVLSPIKYQIVSFKKSYFFLRHRHVASNRVINLNSNEFNSLNFRKQIEGVPSFTFIKSSRDIRWIQLISLSSIAGKIWYREAEKKSIHISDPTSDSRLIKYSFSIPEEVYNGRGIYKLVYKNMMSEKIPKKIINNPRKMIQSFDILFRISNDFKLKELIKIITKHKSSIPFVKTDEINVLYEKIINSNNDVLVFEDIILLLNIISLILFYFKKNNIKFT